MPLPAPAPASDAFSASYTQAREKFLGAASAAGASVKSFVHPLRGVDDEELALDVVVDGAKDARRVLLVSSGCQA